MRESGANDHGHGATTLVVSPFPRFASVPEQCSKMRAAGKICNAILTGMLIALSTVSAAQAEMQFTIRWNVVEHDVTPAGNVASQGYVDIFSVNGDEFTTLEGSQRSTTIAGQEAIFTTKLGTDYAVSYRIEGKRIIQNERFPGFSITKVVTPSRDGCSATIHYKKIPGRGAFESKLSNGKGPSSASRLEVTNITCSTSVIPIAQRLRDAPSSRPFHPLA